MIRLGAISFVNTVPVYSAYRPSEEIELVYDVPARLNARILHGELDVSPVSSACYLRNQDKLLLLDDLSVSSPGAVESVIYVSKTPLGPELLGLPLISVPDDSETSVMLLAYLLKETTGQDLRGIFKTYEAADYQNTLETTGNALVIGDNALLLKESGLADSYHCYDLSTLWQERTGLPFVFAVWVANRHWAEAHPEQLATVNRELCEARDRFFAQDQAFDYGLSLGCLRSGLPDDVLRRYYSQCLSYQLESDHKASLALFEQVIQSAADWEVLRRERQHS